MPGVISAETTRPRLFDDAEFEWQADRFCERIAQARYRDAGPGHDGVLDVLGADLHCVEVYRVADLVGDPRGPLLKRAARLENDVLIAFDLVGRGDETHVLQPA